MKTATKIKDLTDFRGHASLYKLSEAIVEGDLSTDHVIVSACNVPFGGEETYIFPATDGGPHAAGERVAKALCARCDAVRHCRDYAIPIENLSGVWGAMTAAERERARRKRGI